MRYFRITFIALVALLWLPVSAHCLLETATGLQFLECQTEGQSSGNPDSHCTGSGCCSVERSHYTVERAPISPRFVALDLITIDPVQAPLNCLPTEVSLGILTAAPPELSETWHFVSRTALPARAPSAS